jgi:hypothetical protein
MIERTGEGKCSAAAFARPTRYLTRMDAPVEHYFSSRQAHLDELLSVDRRALNRVILAV